MKKTYKSFINNSSMEKSKQQLQIKTYTWENSKVELIDYQASTFIKASFTIDNEGTLVRSKNIVSYVPTLLSPPETKKLLSITKSNNDYYVHTNSYEHSTPHTNILGWFVYNTNNSIMNKKDKSLGNPINKGDIIKIGTIKIKVKDIHFDYDDMIHHNSSDKSIKKSLLINNNQQVSDVTKKRVNKMMCRICFCSTTDDDESIHAEYFNPLIQPCSCSGTMKYIHLKCLRQWLQSKYYVKCNENDYVTSFLIKDVECELCKTKLPDYVKINNNMVEISTIPIKSTNYILLESFMSSSSLKYLHIVSFDKINKITFGRGNDCALSFDEGTVSRLHGSFMRDKNNLYINDNQSKFGSLVLVQCPQLKIGESRPLVIQIGKTYMSIEIKEPFSLFGCCDAKEINMADDYRLQNKKALNPYYGSIIKEEYENDDVNESYNTIKDSANEVYLKVVEVSCNEKEEDDIVHKLQIQKRITMMDPDKDNINSNGVSPIVNNHKKTISQG